MLTFAVIVSRIMNVVKNARERFGFTQMELAEKSGLSLRTIQRAETNSSPPKGHTLKSLAAALDLNPAELQGKFVSAVEESDEDIASIQWINIATLGFFAFPLMNILIPYYLWRNKKSNSVVNESGRRIINFQILWTICLYLGLCISPFIDIETPGDMNLILLVLFGGILVNLFVMFRVANQIRKRNFDFLDLIIRVF